MLFVALTLAGSQSVCNMSWFCVYNYLCAVAVLFPLQFQLAILQLIQANAFALSPYSSGKRTARRIWMLIHIHKSSHKWLKYRYKCNRFWITLWPKAHASTKYIYIYMCTVNMHSVWYKDNNNKLWRKKKHQHQLAFYFLYSAYTIERSHFVISISIRQKKTRYAFVKYRLISRSLLSSLSLCERARVSVLDPSSISVIRSDGCDSTGN